MFSLSNVTQVITIAATIVGTGLGAWAAIIWHYKMRQEHEYKVAKNLAVLAYKFQRIIRTLRLKSISNDGSENETLEEFHKLGPELDTAFLEGRFHWGKDFYEKYRKPFLEVFNEWNIARKFCAQANAGQVPVEKMGEVVDTYSPVAYLFSDDDSDDFSVRIRKAVEDLEEQLVVFAKTDKKRRLLTQLSGPKPTFDRGDVSTLQREIYRAGIKSRKEN